MSPSWLTTPREYDLADSIDQEKLLNGLETRTTCCHQIAPTDCLNAVCGHGHHDDSSPDDSSPDDSSPDELDTDSEWTPRDDLPCILYAYDPALTYHHNCTERRSYHEALEQAQLEGLLRDE